MIYRRLLWRADKRLADFGQFCGKPAAVFRPFVGAPVRQGMCQGRAGPRELILCYLAERVLGLPKSY